MNSKHKRGCIFAAALLVHLIVVKAHGATTPDKLLGVHSARNISTSYPWIAQEAGLFRKYNLDFNLVFIASSNIVTAALLSGDAEMTVTGGIGNVAAFVRGSTDIVFIGGAKNVLTQTLWPLGISKLRKTCGARESP